MKYLIESLPGQMHGDIATTDVTVSGGPTPLPGIPLAGRKDFVLQNGSAVDIWVGGPNVTKFDGLKVSAGDTFNSQLGRASLWGVTVDTATTVSGIRVLEIA